MFDIKPMKIKPYNIYGEAKKKRDGRRAFSQSQRKEILYQQDSKCARCHKRLDPRAIEFDHKKAWASGGRTKTTNGRALCADCHKIVTHEQRLGKIERKRKKSSKKKTKKVKKSLNTGLGLSSFNGSGYKIPRLI